MLHNMQHKKYIHRKRRLLKSPHLVLTTSTATVEMRLVALIFSFAWFPFYVISILIAHKLESPNKWKFYIQFEPLLVAQIITFVTIQANSLGKSYM